MTSRIAVVGILLAAVVAGLSFGPVFTVLALLPPVLAVVVPVGLADALTVRFCRLAVVRAPLALLAGAIAGTVVLALPGPPWGQALLAVRNGALQGWLRTLESTFPARPDPELLAFVPVLVLIAAVMGVEWLRRGVAPAMTLVPSLAVLAVAQVYEAASGWPAVALALGFGTAGAFVLAAGRRVRPAGRRLVDAVTLIVPVVLVAALGAVALAAADPIGRPAFSVHNRFEFVELPSGAVSPLAEIGGRLDRPEQVAFTVRTDATVERWPLIVLDGFDGAGWTSSARYRPLGAELAPDPAVTVPVEVAAAEITLAEGLDGPWLPTQFRTLSVGGVRPAVDPVTGTLLLAGRPGETPTGDRAYSLRWRVPQPAADELIGADLDRSVGGSVEVTELPQGVQDATDRALGGAAPSFATALRLERWFEDSGYTLASGVELPTGSGSAQLLRFLDQSKQGTSEQFAAAYVLMARAAGIPARLVVGFRAPEGSPAGEYVVRYGDAFAWPEVAVQGLGWVALDPTGGLRQDSADTGPTTQALDEARDQAQQGTLPVPLQAPAAERPVQATPGAPASPWSAVLIAVGSVLLVSLGWILGVPLLKRLRRRRRRRQEAGQAVVGAWRELRDQLRDHGVPSGAGMTVRDLVAPTGSVLNGSSGELERLARCVDTALWSGSGEVDPSVVDEAWAAESSIRRALAERPVPERVRAAVRVRGLARQKS